MSHDTAPEVWSGMVLAALGSLGSASADAVLERMIEQHRHGNPRALHWTAFDVAVAIKALCVKGGVIRIGFSINDPSARIHGHPVPVYQLAITVTDPRHRTLMTAAYRVGGTLGDALLRLRSSLKEPPL